MSSFITQIIIDNITTTQTTADLIEQTKSIFTDKIKDIKKLQKGGLIITPSHAEHIHDLTDITHYPTASYGRNLYIHKTNNDNNQLPLAMHKPDTLRTRQRRTETGRHTKQTKRDNSWNWRKNRYYRVAPEIPRTASNHTTAVQNRDCDSTGLPT